MHLVTLNPSATGNDFEKLRENHRVLLVNNGIHPGESDGIDATMLLYRDLAQHKIVIGIAVHTRSQLISCEL